MQTTCKKEETTTSYTYKEAYDASLKYFGNDLSAKAFVDKYALRDDNDNLLELTPDDMHHRIARELARIEKNKFQNPLNEDKIYSYLKNFGQIIPQGSPMYGIGNPYQIVSISNCFVAETPPDSYGGLMHTDEQLVQLSKRRCGVGICLDKLRPEGTATKNSSRYSTGLISWMQRYSNSIREVGQGGRRGALMLTLNVHHPQILDFINAKKDRTKVTGANISVQYTDEFLKAVENDTEYEQRWPVDSDNPSIVRKVKAREVWDAAVEASWDSAEPGLQFIDNVWRESPADCYSELGFKTITSNPCQPGWAKILTTAGIKDLSEIKAGDYIWSKEGWTKVTKKWYTGIKDVYKYTTTGGIFYGTKDHKLVGPNGKISAKDCSSVEIIVGPEPNMSKINQCIIDGLVFGDGGIHKASNNLIGLYIGENDKDYFESEIDEFIGDHRPGISPYFYEVDTDIEAEELVRTFDRRIPERYLKGSSSVICSFLRGLYSANGSVCGNRITLKSASQGLIEDVQLMLSSIGIKSYWTKNKSNEVEFANGIYTCKESYDLNISTDRIKFVNNIGFIQKYKNDKIKIVNSSRVQEYYNIVSIEKISTEEVFDITVDNESHTYWTQGCNVSNCSEIYLSELDSCRLLVLNLFNFVRNPFTKDAYFDYFKFYEFAQIAQRMMDNIIDLELECIQKIIDKIKSDPEKEYIKQKELYMWQKVYNICETGRRTGTGVTALGDTLAALNITYGSDESVETTEEIYKTLKLGCYRSSVDMARELGPFPIWDKELEKDNPFLNRIKDEHILTQHPKDGMPEYFSGEEIYLDMQKYGRRNIALLTTAPTGTTSMMAGLTENLYGTTSGIEPLFMSSYTRRKKGNPGDKDFRSDFVDDSGDHWMEFAVFHPGIELYKKISGDVELKNNPYVCASDINWENRVKIQAVAQKHIDHSISSTVNLPKNVKQEEVEKIFKTAWKSGCKGITVYRDGCRTGVLVQKEEKKQIIERPKELRCQMHHITVKGSPYFVVVGLKDDQPYEIFAGKNGFMDKKYKEGVIIKKRGGLYKVVLEDDYEISPITAHTTDEEDVINRLISISLRQGVSIETICDQLTKSKGDLTQVSKGIARVLSKYVKEKDSGEACPECGNNMIFSEGCKKCSCGYSKCS